MKYRMFLAVGVLALSCGIAHGQQDSVVADTNTAITTAPVRVATPTPKVADVVPLPDTNPLTVRTSFFVQTVPIMELVGVHAEIRLEYPFGDSWLRGIGLHAGVGYSIYTPSFVPVMIQTLWGKQHLLDVSFGTSLPINSVYGTNKDKPLTWPNSLNNITVLVGYRYQAKSQGIMYRVFLQSLTVPGTNGGPLPCLGSSIGFTF